jgi:hypothetical protein
LGRRLLAQSPSRTMIYGAIALGLKYIMQKVSNKRHRGSQTRKHWTKPFAIINNSSMRRETQSKDYSRTFTGMEKAVKTSAKTCFHNRFAEFEGN